MNAAISVLRTRLKEAKSREANCNSVVEDLAAELERRRTEQDIYLTEINELEGALLLLERAESGR